MTWRERRKFSYLMHDFDDWRLPEGEGEKTAGGIIKQTLDFFAHGSLLLYPAKSYFVAIIYGWLLHKHFGEPFPEVLTQPDLLVDDIYFQHDDGGLSHEIYASIIIALEETYGSMENVMKLSSVQKTIAYFEEEFLIGTDC